VVKMPRGPQVRFIQVHDVALMPSLYVLQRQFKGAHVLEFAFPPITVGHNKVWYFVTPCGTYQFALHTSIFDDKQLLTVWGNSAILAATKIKYPVTRPRKMYNLFIRYIEYALRDIRTILIHNGGILDKKKEEKKIEKQEPDMEEELYREAYKLYINEEATEENKNVLSLPLF
jgi:hypothetical protein